MDERPDGIDMVEDVDVPDDPEVNQDQKGRHIGNRPSVDDALIKGGGSSFSPIQAVLKASEEPLEYLVRSNLENFEIQYLILDNSLRHMAVHGRLNASLDAFLFITMRRSLNGRNNAMQMAKEMYMGRQDKARDDRREGVLSRMTTLDQHQIEQNGAQR